MVENMREIGAPVYTEEELEFARKIGENVDPEEKRTSGYACPGWEDLIDLDLNRARNQHPLTPSQNRINGRRPIAGRSTT